MFVTFGSEPRSVEDVSDEKVESLPNTESVEKSDPVLKVSPELAKFDDVSTAVCCVVTDVSPVPAKLVLAASPVAN